MSFRFILTGAFLMFSLAVFSQSSLQGTLVDKETKQPLFGAVVVLINKTDSTSIHNVLTDPDGVFYFEQLPNGSYLFKTMYLGYKTKPFDITLLNEKRNLDSLYVEEATKTTDEIVITGKMLRVEQRGDTTIYNADAYKTNPDATAEDLVTKMPGITTDGGTVKAQGETVKRVMINGKEFFGDDATLALKNLPAEIIDKIQVYDRLSDQSAFTGFDDGNSEKVINIITKDNKTNGQFGKVYAGYGTDEGYQAGANLNYFKDKRQISLIGMSNNINVQNFSAQDLTGMGVSTASSGGGPRGNQANNFMTGQQGGINTTNSIGLNYSDVWAKKIKATGSYFFNNTNNLTTNALSREYFLQQQANTRYNEVNTATSENYNHRFSGRFEYAIDSSNTIIVSPRFSYQDNTPSRQLAGSNTFNGDSLLSRTINNNSNTSNNYSFSGNALYRHKFAKKGRTFSLYTNSDVSERRSTNPLYSLNEYYGPPDSIQIVDQRSVSTGSGRTLLGGVTFTEPVSKTGIIQFSYNPSWTKNNSDKQTNKFGNISQQYDSLDYRLSNTFENTVLTQRAGVSYRIKKGKTNASIGADYQEVKLNSVQMFPYESTIEKRFSNVLPSANINIKFSDTSNLRIRYRTSTSAPNATQLQNVVDNSNTLLLSAGNQNLKQQYMHSLMLRYGMTKNSNVSNRLLVVNINHTSNYIGNSTLITPVDTVTDGVELKKGSQLRRPVNLEGYWNMNGLYTYSFPAGIIKSNMNLSAGLMYSRTPAQINDSKNISNSYTINTGILIGSNISKKVDFTASYNAYFNIVKNSIQPELNNNYFYHVATGRMNIMPWKGLVITTDINQRLYQGLTSVFNQHFMLWNAGVGYKFMKNDLAELRVTVFDILGQNNSISRQVYDTYVEDIRTNVLTRYVMLTFTYTLHNFKESSSASN